MERKTKVVAEDGKQELTITREFDLPVELVFMAYTDPAILEQWMGTKVIALDNRKHGSYQFETTDPKGNKYHFHGTIHAFNPNRKITRTFEFEHMPFGIQLELLQFTALTEGTSQLTIQTIYESVAKRDQMLQLPFSQGINMAHNRLQEIVNKMK